MPRAANSLSLNEFRQLLKEEEFIDFFNKFICLPAFCQLVVYNSKKQQFLLEPSLPKKQYVLNRNGLLEWLWRKRCCFFVRCRLFHEYQLAKHLISHNLFRGDYLDLKNSDREAIQNALTWLQKRCFGKVATLRRFRKFLQKTTNGFKMYQFWLDAERLYQQIKRRSRSCMEIFNQLKERFFAGSGELTFPQHLLDAAWENLPESHRRGSEMDRKKYGITFTLCLQKLCLNRLLTYWVPRYAVVAKIEPDSLSDQAFHDLALSYLRGNVSREICASVKSNKGDDRDIGTSSGKVVGKVPAIDVTTASCEIEIVQLGDEAESGAEKTKKFRRKRRTKVSFDVHPPPGESSSESGALSESDVDQAPPQQSHARPIRKSKKKRSKTRKKGARASPTSTKPPKAQKRHSDDDDDSDEYEDVDEDDDIQSTEDKDTAGEEDDDDGKRPASSGGSESSESWEGVHDKFRKSKGDKTFKFKDRHRSRSITARTQRFQQVLQNSSNRRTSVTADQPNKQIKTKGKRKADQQVVDNVEDEIELGGSWETTGVKMEHQERRRASGVKMEAGYMENMGGKSLLKAALRLQTSNSPVGGSPPNMENEGFLGTTGSFWDLTREDITSHVSRRTSDASSFDSKLGGSRMMLTKLSGNRRMSRKGSQDSVGSAATMVTVANKKRRPSVRVKPRKTKVTTLTFSLSGDGPTENSQQKVLEAEKPKKKEKKKLLLPKEKKKIVAKVVSEKVQTPQQSIRIFSMDKDYKYRSDPVNERMIVALQTDHASGNPYQHFLVNTDNDEMIDYLNFWRDVEKSRWDYKFGTMNFVTFVESLRSIVTHYMLPTSPYRIESPENLRKSIIYEIMSTDVHEMPWELRKLQMEVLEDLKYSYEAYCNQEILSFYNAAAFKVDEMSHDLHFPGSSSNSLSPHGNKRIPDAAPLAPRLPRKDELFADEDLKDQEKQKADMKARMMRAQKLIVEGHLPSGRSLCTPEDDDDSDYSDDEGRVRSPPPPKLVREPPMDMRTLASLSIRQYPNPKNPFGKQTRVKIIERHPNSASFYKPIKRGGHFLKRPMTRPQNFAEILRDHTHLEFFKRYLKAYRSDAPFLFWVAVEALRNTDNMKERQNKARTIIKRYFHNPKLPANKLLQCNADIIREIPYLDIVTTSMLLTSQNTVAKAIEERWFRKYADTFTDAMFLSPTDDARSVCNKSAKMDRKHWKRAWVIFNDFIKRAAMFMRYMNNEKYFKLFREFLKREIDRDDVVRRADDSMQSDVVAKRSNNMPLIDLSRGGAGEVEKERKSYKQRIINGQLVTFNFLENDLKFWREIQCYKTMADCCSAMQNISKTRNENNKMLKWKATLIVSCYLDSSIHPTVRVNVPTEISEITIESLQNGLIDRALFHEATIYVFPLLLIFWKKFCDEHYKYTPVLSKRFKRIYGLKMTPVIAQAMKNKKILDKQMEETAKPSKIKSRIKTADFPDYLHMDPSKFKKRRGSPFGTDDMSPRLTFSVSRGVTLIEPIRRRKFTVMKSGSPDVRVVLDSVTSTALGARGSSSSRSQPKAPTPRTTRRTTLLDVNLLEQFARVSQGM